MRWTVVLIDKEGKFVWAHYGRLNTAVSLVDNSWAELSSSRHVSAHLIHVDKSEWAFFADIDGAQGQVLHAFGRVGREEQLGNINPFFSCVFGPVH